MTESYVWVVTRLTHLCMAPTVSRYRLVRRLPAGGAVTLQGGREVRIRPSMDVTIHDTAGQAAARARDHAATARRRVADVLAALETACRVHDVPA